MEAALTASMRRTSHEIFSGHFVSFVVKKIPLSPSFTDVLLRPMIIIFALAATDLTTGISCIRLGDCSKSFSRKELSMTNQMHRSNRFLAFTLIELLIVVGIIMILAAFLFPSLTRARETAMQVYCSNNLKQLSSASVLYRNDHKKFPLAEMYYLDDFTQIHAYLRNLKVFACVGNPQTVDKLSNAADLNGGTDYLYWPGGEFEDIEKNGNTNNGHGNNINVYGKFDPSNPKFARTAATKIKDAVIYDRCGPAHCDTINIVYLLDTHVQVKRDMCDLWLLNSSRELMWKNVSSSDPFPSLSGK